MLGAWIAGPAGFGVRLLTGFGFSSERKEVVFSIPRCRASETFRSLLGGLRNFDSRDGSGFRQAHAE